MPTIGVILAGCGVQDGSEIHETLCTLLALDTEGINVIMMAPDKEQHDVINHITAKPAQQTRNVLEESARIARGKIRDIAMIKASHIEGVIIPGGFGSAKNLCDFAIKGVECTVDPHVERLLKDLHAQGKPIGAMCIAPVILAKVFKDSGIKLTIGKDPATARAVEMLGCQHVECEVEDVVIDQEHLIVTTPAYMLARKLSELNTGIPKLVKSLIQLMAKEKLEL